MKYNNIIIEKKEFDLLRSMISSAPYHRDQVYKTSLEKLKAELKEAKIVSASKMPGDVIRLNSTVTIKTPWNVTRTYQIVAPDQSDVRSNKISVLAPMGLALMGYAKGDEVEWEFPMGPKIINILDVEQATQSFKLETL